MVVSYNILIDKFKDSAIKDKKVKLKDQNIPLEIYRTISNASPEFHSAEMVYFNLPSHKGFEKFYVEFDYYFPKVFDLKFYSQLCFYFGKISSPFLLIDLLLIDKNKKTRYIEGIPIIKKKLTINVDKSYSKDTNLEFNPAQTAHLIFRIYENNGDQVDLSLRWINAINLDTI